MIVGASTCEVGVVLCWNYVTLYQQDSGTHCA